MIMLKKIRLSVNGKTADFEIDTGETLLEVLRKRLHLTGAKEGCGAGECGACTVLVDGTPINSCLYLGVWADGRDIVTIEGIARDGELSKVQKTFISEGAVQCGFCTPGVVITATAMTGKNKQYSAEEIKTELAGHFCRCTGYQNIIRAVQKALDD
ncbi:MAG: (2Fe-2S)-binding protein [Bacillota bacterium]|nr:(2Fe-2S)-binding protein [Bacillota bacterium]